MEVNIPDRGEIYLVNFDPTIGAEIRKTRPGLILQNDIGNRYSPITIVAAITSFQGEELYPTEVRVRSGGTGLSADSIVVLNHIRSIDKQRLIRRIGRLDGSTMQQVNRALQISIGLVDV
jgi:mRNA interferase MazF